MKEYVAFASMALANEAVLCHDDVLILSAQKTRTGSRNGDVGIGLAEDYRKRMVKATDKDGNIKITGWWHPDTGEHHGPDWPDTAEGRRQIQAQGGWWPINEYILTLGDGVQLRIGGNMAALEITNLHGQFAKRCALALKYVDKATQAEVIPYTPRRDTVSLPAKKRQEAGRQRLKRAFTVQRYEHNLLVQGALGQQLMAAFKDAANEGRTLGRHKAPMVVYDGTVYLTGHKPAAVNVKFYDIGHRDGGAPGQHYKLESTFKSDVFHAKGLGVADLGTQTQIQAKLSQTLVKTFTEVLALAYGTTAYQGLTGALNMQSTQTWAPVEVARELLQDGRTLTQRVQQLEARMARLEQLHQRELSQEKPDYRQPSLLSFHRP